MGHTARRASVQQRAASARSAAAAAAGPGSGRASRGARRGHAPAKAATAPGAVGAPPGTQHRQVLSTAVLYSRLPCWLHVGKHPLLCVVKVLLSA